MRHPLGLVMVLALSLGCDALGGRELQATDIVVGSPFAVTIPAGAAARSVWVYFEHDQTTHFVIDGELTAAPPGMNPHTFPVHFTANQFTQGSVPSCQNPTGQGPGRCVSSSSFNFRTFNRDVSGRTFLFDVPPSSAPIPLTGQLRRTVGVASAPSVLRVVITG
ncbi:MAG: hypothetical protein U0325_33735 [Polyangiales bacterium]